MNEERIMKTLVAPHISEKGSILAEKYRQFAFKVVSQATKKEIKQAFFVALWFMVLTFPIMVIKVNTIKQVVIFRWSYLFWIGIGTFFASLAWNYFLHLK